MKKIISKLFMTLTILMSLTQVLPAQNNVSTLNFDGVNDYVKYNDNATLGKMDAAENYTIECWIHPHSDIVAEYDRILQRYSSFAFVMYDENNDNEVKDWYFYVYDNSSSSWKFYNTEGDATLTLDSWNHLAVINNSIDNTLKLFVNGTEVTQNSGYSALTLRPSQNSDNLYIGSKGASTPNNSFGGKIDEVRLKNVAINPNDLHSDLNSPEYTSDANTAALFHFNEGSGTTTANAAGGSATINGAVWGTIGDLWFPIQLSNFNAKSTNESIVLNWTTLSETNNKGFEIQYSNNGTAWETLGFVRGQGTSRDKTDYQFVDKTPENLNFYRLKQIDFDGESTYSKIISIAFSNANRLTLFPNPISDIVNIRGINTPKEYTIYDNSGKIMSTGKTDRSIDINNFKAGIYYLKINGEVHKLVKL